MVLNDQKKIYEITLEGKNSLKILLQKHQAFQETMKSIISAALEFDSTLSLEHLDKFKPYDPLSNSLKELSKEQTLEQLMFQRKLIIKQIENQTEMLRDIDEAISKLEKK